MLFFQGVRLKPGSRFAAVLGLVICLFCTVSASQQYNVQKDINDFFNSLRGSFSRLAGSSQLKSTRLKDAEMLFIATMKKNRVYYKLLRINSEGKVISEATRGKKVTRPMRDISSQRWFGKARDKREEYYSLIKDKERGRYYLLWCRPVIKDNHFVGAIAAEIDLWDSFHEYSNRVYYPFLIKLKNRGLFSHKWRNSFTYEKRPLQIPGTDDISVLYIPEIKDGSPLPKLKDPAEEIISLEPDQGMGGMSVPWILILSILTVLTVSGLVVFVLKRKNKVKESDT